MLNLFEFILSLRYVRIRAKNHFISFISLSSVIGVTLGVMALITVLSVMNGFEKEIKERILGVVSHATILGTPDSLQQWDQLLNHITENDSIIGAAPYFSTETMLVYNKEISGSLVRGIIPQYERGVSNIVDKVIMGDINTLQPGAFNIVLGAELVQNLGLSLGDKVTVFAPEINSTPIGILPRFKRFTLTGIFAVGMHEFDSSLALVNLDDALHLFRQTAPSGLRIKTDDIFNAPSTSRIIANQLTGNYQVIDWTQRHQNFFRALKIEKTMMFIILLLIIMVAVFNILSTLVMSVRSKQSDIGILRSLGATRLSILIIFIIQGILIGISGILLGTIGGIYLVQNLEYLIRWVENLIGQKFLSPDIYYISDLPVDMRWEDIMLIDGITLLLCLLATIYPALNAANTRPTEALRYD